MHASLPGISLFRLPNLIIVQVNVVCIRLSLPCRVRVPLPIRSTHLWSNNNRLTEMVPPWLFQIPRVYCIFLSGGEVSRVTLAGVFRVENTESERNGLCTYYYSGSDEFWSWVQCREEQPPERSHFLMRESDNNAFQKKIHITRQHCPQYLISRWHDWRDVQPQLAERLGLGAQKGQYFARKLRRGRQDRRNVMDIKLPFPVIVGQAILCYFTG